MTESNMENQAGSSGTSVPTPASGTPPATSAFTSDMLHALDELIERKLQSGKDKRFAKIEGKLDGFESSLQRLDELIGKGFNKDQALEIMRLQGDTAPTTASEPPKPTAVTSGRSDTAATSVDDGLLRRLGLDPTDSDVVTALSDLSDGRKTLEKLATLVNKPKPTQAQQMPVSGGTSAPDAVTSTIEELNLAMREPSKNMSRIKELNKRLKELS